MKTILFCCILILAVVILRIVYAVVRRIIEKMNEDFEKRDY